MKYLFIADVKNVGFFILSYLQKHMSIDDTDEVFIVIEGSMGIEFNDRTVELNDSEMIVVNKAEQHKPFASEECKVLIVEPRGVINTGDSDGNFTAENDEWI